MKKLIVLVVLAMLFVGACSSPPIVQQEVIEVVVTATPKVVVVSNNWEHTGQWIIDEFDPKSGWGCNPLRGGAPHFLDTFRALDL